MSEEFYFGDLLNFMQNEIESDVDQIELNIGKLRKHGNSNFGGWNLS